MNPNLQAFLTWFAEYLIVFLVFIVAIVFAVKIGIAIRKAKNEKEAKEVLEDSTSKASES